MLDLAQAIPGFAGFFFAPGTDRIVLSMTEAGAAHFQTAQEAVLATLATDVTSSPLGVMAAFSEFDERVVDYSFLELAQLRARLRPYLPSVPGVTSLEVDEESNRIRVGLTDFSAADSVESLATALAVPIAMMSFYETPAVQVSAVLGAKSYTSSANGSTLRSRISVPDSSLRAGYQIQAVGGGYCTLGFTAITFDGQPAAVSNSHCSSTAFSLDNAWSGQPTNSYHFGWEIVDPDKKWCFGLTPPFKIGPIPIPIPLVPHPCRDADAALMRVDTAKAAIALGEIARTIDKSNCDDCRMSLDIDEDNPTIQITSIQPYNVANEILHKIGRTTGWTFGAVEQTCVDWFSTGGMVIKCSDVVDYSNDPGDSGSPVFEYDDDRGTAQLRGIHWGWIAFPWHDGVMSDLGQIVDDLGAMWVLDPGPPSIYIDGPTEVPEETECRWESDARGMYPFTYVWSGVLVGGDSYVTGIVWESGWLKVEVTDLLDRTAQDSIFVTVIEDDGDGQQPVMPEGCDQR
ncbi:MAG: hypothetical protein OXQ94_13065 [Gemmatimonadota bacterium]|nr:hypothetical protein [Gemmatimonadota bacterium]